MKNSEYQKLLSTYPPDIDIKHLVGPNNEVVDYDGETLLLTSETAYVDADAPEEDHDTEDGKVMLGYGKKYLLLNAIIV